MSLESHPGIGTTFTITIPVKLPNKWRLSRQKQNNLWHSLKVEYINRGWSSDQQAITQTQLNLLGYDVDEATDGVQALHKSVCNIMICLLLTLICRIWMFWVDSQTPWAKFFLTYLGASANAQANEREKGLNCGMNLCCSNRWPWMYWKHI